MRDANPIFEKRNILVTGGAGFIGSHLCERLLKDAKVICVDDLSNSSIHNVEHLLQYPDFEFINFDVTNPIDLDSFEELDKFGVRYQGVQEIYHLACPTSPKNFEHLRLKSLLANSKAMISTLDLAVKYKSKYVFGSSSVVYGNPVTDDVVFDEEQEGIVDHLSPRACYDEGKRFAETCVFTYKDVYNIDAKIARIFATYGPRMRLNDGLFVPDFILNALDGEDMVIYGDEDISQTLMYVSDLVDGLVRLMKSGPDVPVVNLGSDHMVRVRDIASLIIEMTDSSSGIRYEEPLVFLTKKGIPNLAKAKELLQWLPLVRLQDGLRKTVDYAIANRGVFGLGHEDTQTM